MFKLHLLGSELGDDRTILPDKLDYKKVIKDYLEELGKDIKKRVENHWSGTVDFNNQVIIVLTVIKKLFNNGKDFFCFVI